MRWCCLPFSIKHIHIICIALDYRVGIANCSHFEQYTANESVLSIPRNDNTSLAICLLYPFSNLQICVRLQFAIAHAALSHCHHSFRAVYVIIHSRDRRYTVVKLLFSFAIIWSCWLSQFQVMPKQIFAHLNAVTPTNNDEKWVPFFPYFHSFTLYWRINRFVCQFKWNMLFFRTL